MAFSEFELASNLKALGAFLERRRPPENLRSKVDLGFSIVGHTIDLFEIRPAWGNRRKTDQDPFARIRFVRTAREWRLYWMRANLKWYRYEPDHVYNSLADALKAVDDDLDGCFFG